MPPPPSSERGPVDDPRLDTTAWIVFGRRFPRRWTLYFRVVAVGILLLALVWWFTRDVTYVDNVKVSGLEQLTAEDRELVRVLAADFAALVSELADLGYAWQSGALPAVRAGGALSEEEAARYLALGSLEVKGGPDLAHSETSAAAAESLRQRAWSIAGAPASLEDAVRRSGDVEGRIRVSDAAFGRQRVLMEITRTE